MISINGILSEDSSVDADDVITVKKALNSLGHYAKPDYGLTRYPDKRLFDAIKSFQKSENLKVDGVIKPAGETIQALNKIILDRTPSVKGPYKCPECGGYHGGVYGELCQWCTFK